VDPAKLRKVTVYRNIYKLVKIQIQGAKVKNKSVSLRPIIMIFPDVSAQLKSSWKVFSKNDLSDMWQLQMFQNEIQKIIDEFALDIKRFGYLIKLDEKAEFEKRLEEEKGSLLNALRAKSEDEEKKAKSKYLVQPEKKQLTFPGLQSDQQKAPRTLNDLLNESKKTLLDYFKAFVDGNEIAKQALLDTNEAVKGMVAKNMIDQEKAVEKMLEKYEIIRKEKLPNNKKTNIYVLTQKGLDLTPAMIELTIWTYANLQEYHSTLAKDERLKMMYADKEKFIDLIVENYKTKNWLYKE